MKKFLVVLILGLLTINVQAQWYTRSFGVGSISELNEKQLNYSLQRAEANIRTGKIFTFSGISAFTLGTIIAASRVEDFWKGNYRFDQYAAGGMLMLLGMGSTAVGIPLWICNSTRKQKVEIELLRFNSSALTGYQQPDPFGLSLKISF